MKQQIYVALIGKIGEYQGLATAWATSVTDAKRKFEIALDPNSPWMAEKKCTRKLGNNSRREIDSNGVISNEVLFGKRPTFE